MTGNPQRLKANRHQSFLGSYVYGHGFVLSAEDAAALIAADSRNADVVRPYLVGEDLNQRPDGSPLRWVIDFRDWPEERAATYPLPFKRLEETVRPVRAKLNRESYRRRWWQFAEPVPGMYGAIASLERAVVVARVSKTVQPMLVDTGIVFNEKIVVFAYSDYRHFALLSSGIHRWWAVTHSTTLRTDTQYTPTDCFETFPQPQLTGATATLGGELNDHRSALMLGRQEGLTTTYNRVHDPDDQSDDIIRLREIHAELDYAVADAYGWTDLELDHGFHETKFGTRFT
ncbi:MAG: type IIL restriction-modification enzyme MmeI, partial [Mycobacterium sp.]